MTAAAQAPRLARALRPLLVLCVVGVIVVDNVFEFLIVYELTVVAIYALISVRYEDPRATPRRGADADAGQAGRRGRAGRAGPARRQGRELLLRAAGACRPASVGRRARRVLRAAVRGFAVKAALIPLQTWLPGAYAGADADSSGFVAAVSLNVAFYAMLRVWFGFLGHPAVWWAVVALLVGALTALIGILGGVLQRELRLFVAYSSIENAGLIVADLGLALMGKAQHQPGLIGLGLIAATFQITAHSFAKAGLFAAVATVEHSTGTSDMERLGGLYRRLPAAAIATLAGGAALAALPPFSGFVSEWLGLEGLMQGFRVSGTGSHLAMAVAGALLALTAGLAALAFVRAIGMTFFGMPRDRSIEPPAERGGRGSAWACWRSRRWRSASPRRGWSRCSSAAWCRSAASAVGNISQLGWLIEPGYAKFASISPTVLALTLTGFALGAAACGTWSACAARGACRCGRRASRSPAGAPSTPRSATPTWSG